MFVESIPCSYNEKYVFRSNTDLLYINPPYNQVHIPWHRYHSHNGNHQCPDSIRKCPCNSVHMFHFDKLWKNMVSRKYTVIIIMWFNSSASLCSICDNCIFKKIWKKCNSKNNLKKKSSVLECVYVFCTSDRSILESTQRDTFH